MTYVEKLELDIKKIKEFDLEVEAKIEEFVKAIEVVNFEGMTSEEDSKVVSAHKNRSLKVINRVIDKFKKEVDLYILGGKE